MLINELISAILQILAFALIPFVVYLIQYRRAKGFFSYIGLRPSNKKANLLAMLLCLLIGGPLIMLGVFVPSFREILTDPSSVSGHFREAGLSLESVLTLLVVALLKTSLSEEIFFRGFLAKRLINWLGYQGGNIIQAILFGAIHTLLFLTISQNILFLFIIFFFPALGAYFMVYLNEKKANGSILPGWIAHGLANLLSHGLIGFVL